MRRLVVRGRGVEWDCSCCGAHIEGEAPSATLRGLACDACLDRGMSGEPFIPLTVRMTGPKAKPDVRPVVAVCVRDFMVLLESGETFPLEELEERIMDRSHGGASRFQDPPLEQSIVVTDAGVDLLAWLDGSRVADSPFWQWQVALTDMSAWRPEARSESRSVSVQPRPMRFGYASRAKGARRRDSRWYQLIDIHRFCELPGGWGTPDVRELLRFGVELRDWCNQTRIPVGSSGSAIGGRLLRDERFGKGWRRKVPAATNARARRMLPGNHYQLLAPEGKSIPVVHKWDMRSAHHWAALNTRFPHPDTLDAKGFFRHAPNVHDRGAFPLGSRAHAEILQEHGLFLARVTVPEGVAADPLVLPQYRRAGAAWRVISSVELEQVPASVVIGDVWAAWSSPDVDERLQEYSFWAQRELQRRGAPRWLKPALLSAYGLLAAKPREYRSAWRSVKRTAGAVGWQTSHGMLIGMELEPGKPREPQTANVVWRCLIESRVRMEALRFARELRSEGIEVLSIYADAVFAGGDIPAAMRTPPPWRYEGVIHDLVFDGPSRYRSREEMRLPGTPRRRDGLQKALTTRKGRNARQKVAEPA